MSGEPVRVNAHVSQPTPEPAGAPPQYTQTIEELQQALVDLTTGKDYDKFRDRLDRENLVNEIRRRSQEAETLPPEEVKSWVEGGELPPDHEAAKSYHSPEDWQTILETLNTFGEAGARAGLDHATFHQTTGTALTLGATVSQADRAVAASSMDEAIKFLQRDPAKDGYGWTWGKDFAKHEKTVLGIVEEIATIDPGFVESLKASGYGHDPAVLESLRRNGPRLLLMLQVGKRAGIDPSKESRPAEEALFQSPSNRSVITPMPKPSSPVRDAESDAKARASIAAYIAKHGRL